MNSSLEKVVKNVSDDDDFIYWIKEFGYKNSELLKQKVLILLSAWTVLKDLVKKKWLVKNVFTAR